MGTRSSESGERAAIGGYWKQYEYSACVIYRQMLEGKFSWITISDESAGLFDDLLISADGKVYGTQLKTLEKPGTVNLHTHLVKNKLIKEIATSWVSLTSKYKEKPVFVRYIFGGTFSYGDKKLTNNDSGTKLSSSDFAEYVNRHHHTKESIAKCNFSEALEELRVITKFGVDRFVRFLNSLELLDRDEQVRNKVSVFAPIDRKRIEQIRDLIPKLVSDNSKNKKLYEDELLDRLGWRSPLSKRNQHVFPVAGDYQDNPRTRTNLSDAISHNVSGYVSLVGGPGTGKSTILQRSLVSNPNYVVARYLAFVPDQRFGLGRGEASEFYNDLVVSLAETGLSTSRFLTDSISEMRSELSMLLDLCHERFEDTGVKTVIVVDGLDHVPREEKPSRSFLKELPSPSALPDGVIFVLGTQRLDLDDIRTDIQRQAARIERCIDVQPLSKESVFHLAKTADLSSSIDLDQLYAVSAGHPLMTRYYVEALKGIVEEDEIDGILSEETGLGESIEEVYERAWSDVCANDLAIQVFGLMARCEGSLQDIQLAKCTSEKAVEEALRLGGFLLASSEVGRYSIFHNSFRIFLVEKTSIKFGRHSPELEIEYHTLLSEIARTASLKDPQHWFELRYSARALNYDRVLEIATPGYFRNQLKHFRPTHEIFIDLRLSYWAIEQTRNRVDLVNKLLIEKEIEYRLAAVEQLDLVRLHLSLGDLDAAIALGLEGQSNDYGWVQLVNKLWRDGQQESARKIFEVNEPIGDLLGNRSVRSPGDDYADVKKWVAIAHRFRPVDQIISFFEAVELDPPTSSDPESERKSLSAKFRYHLARGIVCDSPLTDPDDVCRETGVSSDDAMLIRLEALFAANNLDGRDAELIQDRIDRIEKEIDFSKLHWSWGVHFADVCYEHEHIELTQKVLSAIETPSLRRVVDSIQADEFDAGLEALFQVALQKISHDVEPGISYPTKTDYFGLIERACIDLIQVYSSLKKNSSVPINFSFRSGVRTLASIKPESSQTSSYRFHASLGTIASVLVEIVAECEAAQQLELIEFLDSVIEEDRSNFKHSDVFRLKYIAEIFELDGNIQNAEKRISSMILVRGPEYTPQELVDFNVQLSVLYAKIGLEDKSNYYIDAMHEGTFGYWLRAKKEPQYQFWDWSFSQACDVNPAMAGEWSLRYGRFILGMDHTEGDDTAVRVLGGLLRGATCSPQAAAGLVERLFLSNLTSWAKVVGCLLNGVAQRDEELIQECITLYKHLVVPFFDYAKDDFIQTIFPELPDVYRQKQVESLVDQALIHCPIGSRVSFLDEFENSLGESSDYILASKARALDAKEWLHPKTTLSASDDADELEKAFADCSSLSELVDCADGRSRYSDGLDYGYSRVAVRLAQSASRAEIHAFCRVRPYALRDARVAIAFSRRMLELGDRKESNFYFEKAEKAAYSKHWSSYISGEKVLLQDLRVLRDGDAGREVGFDVLVRELSSGQTYGSSLFLDLDNIVELITPVIPHEAIWLETLRHLEMYREFSLVDKVTPNDSVTTSRDLLGYILSLSFGFSCPKMVDQGRAAAIELGCSTDSLEVIESLFQHLEVLPVGPRERAALCYQLRYQTHLLSLIESTVQTGLSSNDFVEYWLYYLTAKDLEIAGVTDKYGSVELPTFYQIILTGSTSSDDFAPPPGLEFGSRPVWSDDPWTLTSVLKLQLELISDDSGIDIELLRRRCAYFMQKLGGRDLFGPDAEKEMMDRLERLCLRFTYHRLQPFAALIALGHLVSELYLAGAIQQKTIRLLWEDLGGPNLGEYRFDIVERPIFVPLPILPFEDLYRVRMESWSSDLHTDCIVPWKKDNVILSEFMLCKVSIWGDHLEATRFTSPYETEGRNFGYDVSELPSLSSLDFMMPLYGKDKSKGICCVPSTFFGEIRNSVITICPYLLDELDWSRDQRCPLAIRNRLGDVVANTVVWIDGSDQVVRRESHGFSEGNYLFVTVSGFQEISDVLGEIELHTRVARRSRKQSRDWDEEIKFSTKNLT